MNWSTWKNEINTTIPEAGKYYIKLNDATADADVTLSGKAIRIMTGVEIIGEDSEEVIYYNLEGVRVDNPEKGIYIRVKGKSREKVLF